MSYLTFRVNGAPVGKGRPRFTMTGRVYTPKKTATTEKSIATAAMVAMREAGVKRIERRAENCLRVGVGVLIEAGVPIPKSYSRRWTEMAATGRLLPTGRPDLDNVVKLVMDAINGVVFDDDDQVVRIEARKFYAEAPCVIVTIERIGE